MSVTLSPVGGVAAQFFSNDGVPLAGGLIYTYLAGTNTPAATYTSTAGSIAHSNPIVLDSAGRVPSGEIWLDDAVVYKFVLKDASNVLIATYDNITGINSNFVNYINQQEIQTATAGQTVFTLTTMTYLPGTNSLSVFVDGVNQYGPSAQYAYVETNSTTVTFASGLHVGALVKFTTSQQQNAGVIDASQVSFTGFKSQTGNVENLADDDGSDWIGFLQSGTGAVAESAQDKMRQIVSVLDFGADPTGATDSTTAIQTAINSLASQSTLVINPGIYKITTVTFDGKSNIRVSAYGAQINLVGNAAGFVVKGVCAGITVCGGTITGDGANRDTVTPQIGWLVGDAAGAYVGNVFMQDITVDAANVGFKFSAGTGVGSGQTNNVKIVNCQAKDIVGISGGRGYGFTFSQASYSIMVNCQAINCQRHGIYFAEGRDYAATNCIVRNHRSTVHDNSYRAAFSISRSRNVAVSNCVFDNCYDGTIQIDSDTQGTAPDNVLNGVVVSNCSMYNSALADIRIGTNPVTDANVANVIVSNCVMVRGNNIVSSILVESGNQVKVTDCLIRGYGSASSRAIAIDAIGGASYTDNVEIVRNSISNFDYGIQIASALQTGATSVRILNNYITATTAELEFLGGEDTTTNNNLIYNRSNGTNSDRTYSSSGSLVVIPVGGVDVLTMSPSSATTVSNFSGGVQGQRLTLYFTNGNTTLKNTNLYLQSGADFVSTAYDSLSLVYLSGFWRETGQSIN